MALPKQVWTEAEYLAFERTSDTRHEYHQGEIFEMVGASLNHNRIVMNTSGSLFNQLLQRPCEIFSNDMRLKIPATRLYTYPDIVAVCGEPQLADDEMDILLNPVLIIEVLSPSTETYDRGKKFQDYRTILTLQEYLLVAQDAHRVERFLRQPNGEWLLTDAIGLDAVLDLPSIGCSLALADIYQKIVFEEK
ncbi:MAG: Uma2 family endonuclease [Anaerolineae bacterium]|nr:Uma2 family endonuclease [Anaerolineae bacterium]